MDFETYVLMAILRSLYLVSGTFGHLRRDSFLHFEVPRVPEFASQHRLSNSDQTLTRSTNGVCKQAGVQTPGFSLVPVELILVGRAQVCLLV